MRPAARAALPGFIEKWEGRCSWMYLDNAKPVPWVTCGVGCKVDDGTPGPALGLPWMHKDGTRAMLDEVAAAWHKVKAATSMAPLGGGHFAGLTDLRLEDAEIDALLLRRWVPMEAALQQGFDQWGEFPAAAQLAIADMAFNLGPGRLVPGETFQFPKFRAFCNDMDWPGAATECRIVDAPEARNLAHVALFRAAMGDPDTVPS